MVKLEKVKERALCYIYKNKQASYGELLAKKGETETGKSQNSGYNDYHKQLFD